MKSCNYCAGFGENFCGDLERGDLHGYVCTRKRGHKGDHVSCGSSHALRRWPQVPKVKLDVPKDTTTKLTNPKDAIGSDKLPLHLWPMAATILGSLGLLDGALKYGRANWRVAGVRASIYYDACTRHLTKWFEGEETDPDSGVPHLAHALACLAIIVDAGAAGKLNDDRMVQGGYAELVKKMTPHVKRLKELHKDKSPKHYTIQDTVP